MDNVKFTTNHAQRFIKRDRDDGLMSQNRSKSQLNVKELETTATTKCSNDFTLFGIPFFYKNAIYIPPPLIEGNPFRFINYDSAYCLFIVSMIQDAFVARVYETSF